VLSMSLTYMSVRCIELKPRTFTYNQIIRFFQDVGLPLSPNQISVVAERQREEFDRLEAYKERQKEKANERYLKRLKRKESRSVE
jgi:hypothetical protein